MLIFVYGTLKFGGSLNDCLEGSRFIADGKTVELLSMSAIDFPMAKRPSKREAKKYKPCRIEGEVWDVSENTLEFLDHIEGNGVLYQREIVEVETENRKIVKAWIYFFLHDLHGRHVANGKWETYCR